ncbi:hypothetical protein IJT93_10680 [bacterium]|nr:hypothetical protein [bacterium]
MRVQTTASPVLMAAVLLCAPASADSVPEGPGVRVSHALFRQGEKLPGPQEVSAYREKLRREVKTWLAQKYLGSPKPEKRTENYGRKDLEDMLCIYDLGVDYAFKNGGVLEGFNIAGYENITADPNLLTDLLRLCANTYRYMRNFISGTPPEEKPSPSRPPIEFKNSSSVKDC